MIFMKQVLLLGLIISISLVSIIIYGITSDQENINSSEVKKPTSWTEDIPNDFKIFSDLKDMQEFEVDGVIFVGSAPKDYLDDLAEKADWVKLILLKKPQLSELYKKLQFDEDLEKKTIVVMPTLTAIAYSEPGFYSYYRGECNVKCLTMPLTYLPFLDFRSSSFAVQVFDLLGYDRISDIEIDVNPDVLKKYDKVVLLHSEYVTKKMFDSITHHPNVTYLYPNALYAEIEINYDENFIKLIRGHSYPDQSITNGFDWQYDNTHPYEFETDCKDWMFYEIDNGHMLNCYPENFIIKEIGIDLLMKLKEL